MKKIFILLVTALTVGVSAQKQKFETAVAYNDYVVDALTSATTNWSAAMDAGNKTDALAAAKKLGVETKEGIKLITKAGAYQKDSRLQKTSLDYLKYMNKISGKELVEFINLIYAENFGEAEEKKASALIPVLDGERERLFNLVQEAQKNFARKFNFTIE